MHNNDIVNNFNSTNCYEAHVKPSSVEAALL